jgi:hypothetical protein
VQFHKAMHKHLVQTPHGTHGVFNIAQMTANLH